MGQTFDLEDLIVIEIDSFQYGEKSIIFMRRSMKIRVL